MRWASSLAINAHGILGIRISEKDALQNYLVEPTITKIVLILCCDADFKKIVCQGRIPSGESRRCCWEFIVRNTDNSHGGIIFFVYPESVKVIIQPTDRILGRDMQIPESVGFRNLNSSPDWWPYFLQFKLELLDSLRRLMNSNRQNHETFLLSPCS